MTGAVFALKGYRTQFLYSLYRILSEYNNDYIFQPEGKFEDLDIIDSNHCYIEIIQIKNKLNSLVYSDLISKSTSFFNRASKVISQHPNATIRIISFNSISQELTNKDKLQKKLIKSGFKVEMVEKLIRNYAFEIVNEIELEKSIIDKLNQLSIFSDSKIALELLLYWLFIAGEKQENIFSKNLISKLELIGKFTNEQLAFNNSFGNTIIPFSTKSILNDDIDIYKEGFYYGVSAKFEHILANLDVHREDKLNSINKAFRENNIVFIHAASGQGKSTLAYRYINNFTFNQTSYELKVSSNLKEVFETINSLDSLSRGLGFPILLYIDIKPQDKYWNEILKELYGRKNLRFLITIRQEDWNKTVLGIDFKFIDIDLNFDKKEAKVIYDSLSKFREDMKFIDFEESWSKFNNGGLLLEYVYLINQGDSLESRLRAQIKRIEEKVSIEKTDEIEVLRYVCLADILNSKINYKKLVTKLKIKTPKIYIDYFKKEYLLQHSNDKKYITGLHPIRSKILCEILFNEDNYINKYHYISESIELIDEEDLKIYLLESFYNGYNIITCIETLKRIKFNTWTAYSGVFNALIWKGIYDFVFIKNLGSFNKLYSDYNELSSYLMPFDFTNEERQNGIFGILEEYFSEENKNKVLSIHKEFTDKNVVYDYLNDYLNDFQLIESNVLEFNDVKSLGEVSFWVSELKLDIVIKIDEHQLSKMLNEFLTLKDISILLFGMQQNNYNSFYIIEIQNEFIKRLRKEYNIIFFNETQNIECIYFYDPMLYDEKIIIEENILNSFSVEIIELLRFAFPYKENYSTKGLGFNFFDIDLAYDPTIKNIPISNIPIPYLVTNNALIGNLFNYQFKPENWKEYIDLLILKREVYIEIVYSLIKSFETFFSKNDIFKLINDSEKLKFKIQEIKKISFPKNISDKWGYISDGSNLNNKNNNDNIIIENITALKKYSKFKRFSDDFFNSINNFFNSVEKNIVQIQKVRLSINDDENYNINPNFINLKNALKNCNLFHKEFMQLFSKFCDESKMDQIHVKENRNLEILFNCWHQFNFKKGDLSKKIIQQSNQNFVTVKNDINNRLLKERKLINKDWGLLFDIYLDTKINNILILTCEICSEDFLYSVIVAREFLKNTINVSSTSVKSVYIESNIDKVIYIPFFNGKPINKSAFELMTYNLDKKIEDFEFWANPFYQINDEIIDFLQLDFWNIKMPLISNYEQVLGNVVIFKELNSQIRNIKSYNIKFDLLGIEILKLYEDKTDSYIKKIILESIDLWVKTKDKLDDLIYLEVLDFLNNILNKKQIEVLTVENISELLNTHHKIFVEKLIYE